MDQRDPNLSERAIRRELRWAALQHPATLMPLAIAVLSLIHLAGISPFPGGQTWAVASVTVSGAMAASSFFWIYSVRHDREYQRLIQKVQRTQEQGEEAAMSRLKDAVEDGFRRISFDPGLEALSGLVDEYEQLVPLVNHLGQTGSVSLAGIPTLAEETYRQGLNVLSGALQLQGTIGTSGKLRIEKEIERLNEEIELLTLEDRQPKRLEILKRARLTQQDLLNLLNQEELRADEFLYQSDRCRASLARTRIELAALQAGATQTSVSAVIESLQRTIDQAKEVQEEMHEMGF